MWPYQRELRSQVLSKPEFGNTALLVCLLGREKATVMFVNYGIISLSDIDLRKRAHQLVQPHSKGS